MDTKTVRLIKGILIGICFIGLGVIMVDHPSSLTLYGNIIGISNEFWTVAFITCGIMNIYIGLTNRILNALWLSPLFCFSAAAIHATIVFGFNPFATFLYILVSGLLIVDLLEDIRGVQWKRQAEVLL